MTGEYQKSTSLNEIKRCVILGLILLMAISVFSPMAICAKGKHRYKKLTYNSSKVHMQKVWKVGPTKDYAKLYKLIARNKDGSKMKFRSNKSFSKSINYWTIIFQDWGLVSRNEYNPSTRIFTVHTRRAYKSADNNVKYDINFRKYYRIVKKLGIKNGMDTNEAVSRIEKYLLKHYSRSDGLDYSDMCAAKFQIMCAEAGIKSNLQEGHFIDDEGNATPTVVNVVRMHGHWHYFCIPLEKIYGNKYGPSSKCYEDVRIYTTVRFDDTGKSYLTDSNFD